jgi:GDP-D-mannose dehydratase
MILFVLKTPTAESKDQFMSQKVTLICGASTQDGSYLAQLLLDNGLINMSKFGHNQKKLEYTHRITLNGMRSKAMLTAHIFECKVAEYAMLKSGLEKLQKQIRPPKG